MTVDTNADAAGLVVDPELCTHCDRCVDDCPLRLIERQDDECPSIPAGKQDRCVLCQHCLAICPPGAISVGGLLPANSLTVRPGGLPRLEQLDALVRMRRSVRQYRDANVDAALLARLLDATAHAPTGVNQRRLTFTVIQDKAVLAGKRDRLMAALADASDDGRLPEGELAARILSDWREGRDVVFRGAPHLLLVSSPPDAPCAQQDVIIALAYFELLAQSAQLGTVWCGYVHRMIDLLPEGRELFQLPEGHVFYAMLFGLPAVQYSRAAQRDGSAAVRRLD